MCGKEDFNKVYEKTTNSNYKFVEPKIQQKAVDLSDNFMKYKELYDNVQTKLNDLQKGRQATNVESLINELNEDGLSKLEDSFEAFKKADSTASYEFDILLYNSMYFQRVFQQDLFSFY